MLEKDVVDEKLKGKKKIYTARDPKSIKLNLQRKIESLEQLLPDLEALRVTQKNKPVFRFYDGWQEVKDIYELSLEAEMIYALGSTERLNTLDHAFFSDYTKKCEKRGIRFQDMLTSDSQKSAELIRSLRTEMHQIRFLPEEYSKNITDLLIWNDNLALISLEEPIFGTIITSPPLTGTIKTLLEFIWKHLS